MKNENIMIKINTHVQHVWQILQYEERIEQIMHHFLEHIKLKSKSTFFSGRFHLQALAF